MRSRWTAAGFLLSCLLFTVYWVSSAPLQNQPRYGYYSRRFIDFVRFYPLQRPDQYQYLGNASAALGAFHFFNPPLLITTLGSDRFHASETLLWRADWRFAIQAVAVSFWWWWLLGRLAWHRGSARVTLCHVALVMPISLLLVSLALYHWAWIQRPHGLTGFPDGAVVITIAVAALAVAWARSRGFWGLRRGIVWAFILVSLCLLLWPPQILASSRRGARDPQYSFVGHAWLLRHVEPSTTIVCGPLGTSRITTTHESHVALNLLAIELLVGVSVLVACLGVRPSKRGWSGRHRASPPLAAEL